MVGKMESDVGIRGVQVVGRRVPGGHVKDGVMQVHPGISFNFMNLGNASYYTESSYWK